MKTHFFFAFVAAVLFQWAGTAKAAPEKPTSPLVFTEKIKFLALHDQLTYPARLVSKTSAALLAETDGVVRRISAPLGRTVRRDETVLTISNTDPIYQYAPMTVRSPVAGVVSSVDVTEGSRVSKGQRLASVTDPTQVKIMIEVAAADLFAIRRDLAGELSVPSQEAPIPVAVLGMSPFVDPATGTATVELSAIAVKGQKKGPELPPGLVGRVSFKVREHQGIQVPETAIVYRGRVPALRIVENGKARYALVTLGPSRRGFVEIEKGIVDGAEIIVRSSSFVAEGEVVKVQTSEEPRP